MKTWKLVAGILNMVLFVVVAFQSCAAGVVNTIEESESVSGSAGIFVAILMLVGGIVSVVVRKQEGKGGNIALVVLFGMAFLIGISNAENFGDLKVWAVWCAINAGLALLCCFGKKKRAEKVTEAPTAQEE